jgi:hypothetical protein
MSKYELDRNGSIMNEDVADGQLLDVRGEDLVTLLAETHESSMKTALDRLFMSSAAGLNGFNNSI